MLTMKMTRGKVALTRPVPVTVYDYDNPGNETNVSQNNETICSTGSRPARRLIILAQVIELAEQSVSHLG